MTQSLLIAGASVRSAVDSALRAGFKPLAIDQYNDEDLRQRCPCHRIEHYPSQLVEISQQIPPLPWIYTGGLEKHPQIVDQVSCRHHLLGNPGSVLRQACDPFLIQQILADHDLHYPLTRTDWSPKVPGRWLRKSIHSTGGKGVQWANQGINRSIPPTRKKAKEEFYYQQFIPGICGSAVFIANRSSCRLIGATRQLIGKRFTGGSSFSYSGSLGPIGLSAGHQSTLSQIGDALTSTIGLRGLFGIDFVCADHEIWTIEINARFSASIEILEAAFDISCIDFHYQACQDSVLPPVLLNRSPLKYGKAIVYARKSCTITPQCCQTWSEQSAQGHHAALHGNYSFADIPAAGTTIPTGKPILSLIAQGKDCRAVQRCLIEKTKQVRQQCSA